MSPKERFPMSTFALLPPQPVIPRISAAGWSFPAVADVTLGSGTRIVSVDLPGRALVAVRVLLAAPLSLEARDGLFTLLSRLWADGPMGMTGLEFATATESLGATCDRLAYPSLAINLDVASRNLLQALTLAAAPLAEPEYARPSLERELRNQRAEYESMLDDPSVRVHLESARLTYAAGCRESRPEAGTPADLRGVSVDELLDAHRRHIRPELATVVLAGDLGGRAPAGLVEEAFDKWKPSGDPGPRPVAAELEPGPDPGARSATPRPGAVQANLAWARCVTGLDRRQWAAVSLAMSILGGGMRSRLSLRLREELGLTYGITASASRLTAAGGALSISTAVDAGAVAAATNEAERIVGEALADGFTAEEVDQAILDRLGGEPIAMQSAEGVASAVVACLTRGDGLDTIDEARRTYEQLQPSEALAALRTALPDGRLTFASVGPMDPDQDRPGFAVPAERP